MECLYRRCVAAGQRGTGLVHIGAGGTADTGDVTVYDNSTINLDLGSWTISSDLDANYSDDDTGATLKFTFNATDNGEITVDGNVDIANATITFAGSGLTGVETGQIDFITASGTITGFDVDNTNIDTVMTGLGFAPGNCDLDVVTGSDILRLTYVPEPATMVLLGLGGIGVLLKRRRKSRA